MRVGARRRGGVSARSDASSGSRLCAPTMNAAGRGRDRLPRDPLASRAVARRPRRRTIDDRVGRDRAARRPGLVSTGCRRLEPRLRTRPAPLPATAARTPAIPVPRSRARSTGGTRTPCRVGQVRPADANANRNLSPGAARPGVDRHLETLGGAPAPPPRQSRSRSARRRLRPAARTARHRARRRTRRGRRRAATRRRPAAPPRAPRTPGHRDAAARARQREFARANVPPPAPVRGHRLLHQHFVELARCEAA